MRGRWVAVLALTAMLAGCGTAASRPAAQATGTAAVTRAPAGSRAEALTLARQMLSRLVVPTGSQAARPSPVPPPLSVSSAGGTSPYTVELHRFVLVREPAATVHSFLLAHVPAGMSWAGVGLAPGTTNTVTVLWVGTAPESLASGLTNAELGTAAMPSAGGDTLIRADASVSWFPPRSATEQLNAASFRSVTVTATEVIPRPRTVTRTFTSPAVIGRLVALVEQPARDTVPGRGRHALRGCRYCLPARIHPGRGHLRGRLRRERCDHGQREGTAEALGSRCSDHGGQATPAPRHVTDFAVKLGGRRLPPATGGHPVTDSHSGSRRAWWRRSARRGAPDQEARFRLLELPPFGVGVVAGATGDGIMMRFRGLGVRGRAGDAGRSGSRARRRCRRGAAR